MISEKDMPEFTQVLTAMLNKESSNVEIVPGQERNTAFTFLGALYYIRDAFGSDTLPERFGPYISRIGLNAETGWMWETIKYDSIDLKRKVPLSAVDYNLSDYDVLGISGNSDTIKDIEVKPIGSKWCENFFAQGHIGHYTPNMKNLVYYDRDGQAKAAYRRLLIRKKR